MPAYVGGEIRVCGIKWIAGFPRNPARFGVPRANAIIILNEPEKGLPLCIMESTHISALRTGAVTGVGAKYLARHDSRCLGLIGLGVQAWTQLEAVMAVLPDLNEVKIYDIDNSRIDSFLRRIKTHFGNLSVLAVNSPEKCVRGTDVLVTATVADEPIVKSSWLEPGVFFSHIGSYQEEEEAVILNADKVVVDIWEEVLHRGTPLLARMFNEGRIDRHRISAEMGEIITGKKPGRESPTERIFFSPLGLGSEDIILAAEVHKRAVRKKLGIWLPFGNSISL